MSKIVQAVNAMISRPELITKVIKGDEEIFFEYKGYRWSMAQRDDGLHLWYYPGKQSLESLASHEGPDWDGVPMVWYSTSEIGTREAKASFSELYTLLKERIYNISEVLDDIISGGESA